MNKIKLGHYIFTKDKKIKDVPLLEWAKWMEKKDRFLKKTIIKEHLISTIFLGLDHNFNFGSEKILFETMIFYKGTGEVTDEHHLQERYGSYKEAIKGHNKLVKLIKNQHGQRTRKIN